MTAPNHALTGALIGLSISNPVLALPLAFLSHFVQDAIPHYDQAETDDAKRISSKRFLYEFIVLGAALCFAVVLALVISQPVHWQAAVVGAFLAASPDLFWIPQFLTVRKTGQSRPLTNPFLRFHSFVQWKTGPSWLWLEVIWFVFFSVLLWRFL